MKNEPRADARLDELKRSLYLAASANRDVGHDATADLLGRARDEIIALEVGLACCVDRGSFDMVLDALKLFVGMPEQFPDEQFFDGVARMSAAFAAAREVVAKIEAAQAAEGGGSPNPPGMQG